MKSTQAMRDRARELMSKERDDYDRAFECVLDDLEGLLRVAPGAQAGPAYHRLSISQLALAFGVSDDKAFEAVGMLGDLHRESAAPPARSTAMSDEVTTLRRQLATAKDQRNAWQKVAQQAGVCMACAMGAPEPYGCTDCLNTGWDGGAPHGFIPAPTPSAVTSAKPVMWEWRSRFKGGTWDAWESGRYGGEAPPGMEVEERTIPAPTTSPEPDAVRLAVVDPTDLPDDLAEIIEKELMTWRGTNGGIYAIHAAALGVSITLRAALSRPAHGGKMDVSFMAEEISTFLNSIEGDGYGGMAAFEIVRGYASALSIPRNERGGSDV
jgi:hypothetical protein